MILAFDYSSNSLFKPPNWILEHGVKVCLLVALPKPEFLVLAVMAFVRNESASSTLIPSLVQVAIGVLRVTQPVT